MYLLDTDHVSILDLDTIEAFNLGRRLANVNTSDVAVTIISYEEQMRGWLAYVARANTPAKQLDAYRKLRRHIERYKTIPLIDFDEAAALKLDDLQSMRIPIGTMDLKIAATAIANDATLLTRNLSDFRRVPGLKVEDWSV